MRLLGRNSEDHKLKFYFFCENLRSHTNSVMKTLRRIFEYQKEEIPRRWRSYITGSLVIRLWNIRFCTLLLYSFGPCLLLRDQVSHPYKRTDKL
jgi:hypothetical protein